MRCENCQPVHNKQHISLCSPLFCRIVFVSISFSDRLTTPKSASRLFQRRSMFMPGFQPPFTKAYWLCWQQFLPVPAVFAAAFSYQLASCVNVNSQRHVRIHSALMLYGSTGMNRPGMYSLFRALSISRRHTGYSCCVVWVVHRCGTTEFCIQWNNFVCPIMST